MIFNASESCWSDSPGKLQALAGAVPAALILLKTRSSAASSTIHHRKNHAPEQAAQDEADVKASDFQAKEIY